MRESPAFHLLDLLKARGAEVAYYDPHIPVIGATREHSAWKGVKSVEWNQPTISSFDAVVISTAHHAVNYQELADWAPCIIDTRNAMKAIAVKPGQVWKA
jgi:UDP-N-acetyl-D-glucosamine dehydrogenase